MQASKTHAVQPAVRLMNIKHSNVPSKEQNKKKTGEKKTRNSLKSRQRFKVRLTSLLRIHDLH